MRARDYFVFITVLGVTANIMIVVISRLGLKSQPCSPDRELFIIKHLCWRFHKKQLSGNYCTQLCSNYSRLVLLCSESYTRNDGQINIAIKKNDDGKQLILRASEQDILKYERPLPAYIQFSDVLNSTLESYMIAKLEKHLKYYEKIPSDMMEETVSKLWPPYLLTRDGKSALTYADALTVWSLIYQHEYVMIKLYSKYKFTPTLIGNCGQFYIMEIGKDLKALSPSQIQKYSFKKRANLSLQLFDVAEMLSSTAFGHSQLCNVYPLAVGSDHGHLKILDWRWILQEQQVINQMKNRKCETAADCTIFDCTSDCNKTTGYCVGYRNSNNIQIICRNILRKHQLNSEVGLLTSLPWRMHHLRTSIQRCSYPIVRASYTSRLGAGTSEANYKTLRSSLLKSLISEH